MGDDDGDAPVVGGMILQNVELAQHGVVHKVHLTLYLVIDNDDDDHSCYLVTIYNILWKSVLSGNHPLDGHNQVCPTNRECCTWNSTS